MRITRWTPLFVLFPDCFVYDHPFWDAFDFHTWSTEDYEWREDPAFTDTVQTPLDTVVLCEGDCEDYALVAACWLIDRGAADVGIAVCWKPNELVPSHVVAYDADHVYSSGRIYDGSLDDYIAASEYGRYWRRPLSPP